jgi:plastocyanin
MSLRIARALVLFLTIPGSAWAATHQVQVFSFGYDPQTLTIQPGDTVVWTNVGGSHNVQADDGSFSNPVNSTPWTFSHTFNRSGEFGYYCLPHGAPGGFGMAGKIIVAGSTPSFAINFGISGTWHNPATPGQGFLLEVVPALNSLALGWFTWSNTAGDHLWLSGLGPISGDSATVTLQRSSNGVFNNSAPVGSAAAGTATFKFTSCSQGTVTFQRSDTGESGTIPIERLTPVPAACTPPAE